MAGGKLKHPFKHPYGIASCDPPRLKLNRPRLGRLTRLFRASGMRYQVSSTPPIRAQFEPIPAWVGELPHPYQHPCAVASVSGMSDDIHKMWCRIASPAPDVVAVRSVKPSAQVIRSHAHCERLPRSCRFATARRSVISASCGAWSQSHHGQTRIFDPLFAVAAAFDLLSAQPGPALERWQGLASIIDSRILSMILSRYDRSRRH